jgi:pilin isopeptide linkage protein/LPXTG-motif cell wall-anchored protein
MKTSLLKKIVVLGTALLLMGNTPMVAQAAGTATAKIEVEKQITGDTPDEKEPFTFKLEAVDKDAPMPQSQQITINGEGKSSFGEITLTSPCQYHYLVSEVEGTNTHYKYDSSVYEVSVTAVYDDDGALAAIVKANKKGTEEKSEIIFSNQYTAPKTYKLPRTGGAGTAGYLMMGLFLMMISAGGYLVSRLMSSRNCQCDPVMAGSAGTCETGRKQFLSAKWFCLLLLMLGLMLVGGRQVYAADGGITIQLKDLGTPMKNVGFEIYNVGTRNEHGQWVLNENLDVLGTDLNDLTYATQWDAAASQLAYLVKGRSLDVIHAITDESGKAQVSDLEDGMYLVVQQNGETYGDISPFLVSVPYKENGEWISTVTAYPKASYIPKEEKTGKITVTKRAEFYDMDLLELVDLLPKRGQEATYYVGIFQDAEGTVPYGADYIRKITLHEASVGTAVFENLPKGTYYIFETDEYGNAIPVGERQLLSGSSLGENWECQMDEGQSQEVELTTEEGRTGFVNIYYEELPENFAIRADLQITKEVRQNGEAVYVDDTFYAGIFTDEAGEDLYSVFELDQNGTVVEEVPLGGETGTEPVTYYVYETDENGARIEESDFAYTITFDAPSVEVRIGSLEGAVTITNTVKEESLPEITATPQAAEPTTYYSSPEETVTAKPTATPAETSGNSSTSSSVRTGDDTPIALYLCMAAVAALSGVGAMYMRKRRRR